MLKEISTGVQKGWGRDRDDECVGPSQDEGEKQELGKSFRTEGHPHHPPEVSPTISTTSREHGKL